MEETDRQENTLFANKHPLEENTSRSSSTEFAIGQLVALRSDPTRVGVIIDIFSGSPENRYLVFLENTRSTYYASQLQHHELTSPSLSITPLLVFHAYMAALQLNHPSLATLYSLNAARVNYIPYQFRPVLKFIHSDRPRLLIADEVGVGKTIEAGLILRELQARKDVRSVLIICPKPLVTERKWQTEMKRFDEQFMHLDGPILRHCIKETDFDGAWPEQYAKAILPFSLFNQELLSGNISKKNKRGIISLLELNPPPHFDLVIVDEAHHLRNTNTAIHQGVRYFCEQAEAAYNATIKTYKPVSINRRISAGNSEPKTYLRSHHTNAEGQLTCQLCNQAMPFSLPNGEEYFEAYQYTEVLEKEYEANHLALCPNCAAEFQHACQTDQHERAELILNVDSTANEENLVLYLDMPVHRQLRFTQRHLIDLQMAIKTGLKQLQSM